MKTRIITLLIALFSVNSYAQVMLGNYSVTGYLKTATHPQGCDSSYVTRLPDDSIWVNLEENSVVTGTFSAPAVNGAGPDLLLETGFHPSNYAVSLLLSNGEQSAVHQVIITDWITLEMINWYHLFSTPCGQGIVPSTQHILPLDFIDDFDLTDASIVTGIQFIMLATVGQPDFAGAYTLENTTVGLPGRSSKSILQFNPNPLTSSAISKLNTLSLKNPVVKVFNGFGKAVKPAVTINSSTIEIERGDLVKGIYFVQLWDNSGLVAETKLVVD